MSDEINRNKELKSNILIALDYFKEIFRKWYVHLFFIGIFCGLTYWYLSTKITTYQARISFMTNTASSSGAGGLLSMANSFGINIGGGGGGGAMNAEMLAELLTSNRILKTTLLDTLNISGNLDLSINHFQKLVKDSEAKVVPKAIKNVFETGVFSVAEMNILSNAIKQLKKNILKISVTQNGIVVVFCETKNEAFSQAFLVKLVENLRDYYSNKSVQQQQETSNILAFRVDSLYNNLQKSEGNLRTWLNKYTLRLGAGSLTPDEFLTKARLEREADITSSIYKEAVQAHELAKMEVESTKPIIQIVDYPELPLVPLAPVPIIFYGLAIVVALFVSSVFILFFKLINDALNYEKRQL